MQMEHAWLELGEMRNIAAVEDRNWLLNGPIGRVHQEHREKNIKHDLLQLIKG